MFVQQKKHHLPRSDVCIVYPKIDGAFILNYQNLGMPSIYKLVY